jgi:hypothetical protein
VRGEQNGGRRGAKREKRGMIGGRMKDDEIMTDE